VVAMPEGSSEPATFLAMADPYDVGREPKQQLKPALEMETLFREAHTARRSKQPTNLVGAYSSPPFSLVSATCGCCGAPRPLSSQLPSVLEMEFGRTSTGNWWRLQEE
jgi:hypothetical protein